MYFINHFVLPAGENPEIIQELSMDSEVKTLSPSKEGPVKRKSPWGAPAQAPTPCSLAAVMDEELAMKLQHDEEQAFK